VKPLVFVGKEGDWDAAGHSASPWGYATSEPIVRLILDGTFGVRCARNASATAILLAWWLLGCVRERRQKVVARRSDQSMVGGESCRCRGVPGWRTLSTLRGLHRSDRFPSSSAAPAGDAVGRRRRVWYGNAGASGCAVHLSREPAGARARRRPAERLDHRPTTPT